MKKIYKIFALGALVLTASSCKKYLDVNDNPNAPTTTTPQLVLSDALTTTAANLVSFNNYGSFINGYFVNGGGFGGFGSDFTYSYTSTSNTGLFTNTFDNLEDYQYIIDNTKGVAGSEQLYAVANVMKAYNYQMVIDIYGDVPYTEAFQGVNKLTPKYDSAPSIYQSLITNIDAAVALLKANPSASSTFRGADVMFGTTTGSSSTANGTTEITRWIQFAQTVKLRMLNRIQAVSSLSAFANTEYANFDTSIGFLTDDAIVNPGYTVTSGKQNPDYNDKVTDASGAVTQDARLWIPSEFLFSFYDGTKLTDDDRGSLSFKSYPNAVVGTLGAPDNTTVSSSPYYTATGTGILKSATAGRPLLLAAESYFLQAEANMNGKITGSAQTSFDNGIKASYLYLSKTGANVTTADATTFLTNYKADNATSYLANYNLAAGSAQQLEAIITQKYIALNNLFGAEAWAEFRRTGYPAIVNGSNDPTLSFASPFSTSTRADKLPVRLPYPDTEYQLNSQNVPNGINVFTSRIFWDLN